MKTGIFAGSMALLEKIINFLRQDSQLQEDTDLKMSPVTGNVKITPSPFPVETQMLLQINANHTATLISQYEALAFPSDLCSTRQEPKMLPEFDDLKCKIQIL